MQYFCRWRWLLDRVCILDLDLSREIQYLKLIIVRTCIWPTLFFKKRLCHILGVFWSFLNSYFSKLGWAIHNVSDFFNCWVLGARYARYAVGEIWVLHERTLHVEIRICGFWTFFWEFCKNFWIPFFAQSLCSASLIWTLRLLSS